MRRYELMLLFRPDLEDDKLQSAVEKVTRAIVNAGGTLTKVSPWGKRRMAYDIQHFREASYFLLQFDIAPSAIREIERGMLISEEILRHLVTVLEDRGAASGEEELVPAAVAAGADEAAGDVRPAQGDAVPEGEAAYAPVAATDDGEEAPATPAAEDVPAAQAPEGAPTDGDEQSEEAGRPDEAAPQEAEA
jgi:small subunit ribosomal protein S6